MNLKKLLLISSVLLTLSIITIIIFNNMDDHKVYEINEEKEYNNSFLTLMIETEADSGIYEKSNSSLWPGDGYIFNEQMSSCENGGELSWNEELNTINLKTNTAEKCYVYFDIYSPPTLADYIINNIYVDDGVNNLYFHDGIGTHANANLESGDNSYRYSGANPNNYVCFGSDEATCPSDNLYRIIGVFNDSGEYQVKLIKADYTTLEMTGTEGTYYGKYNMSTSEYKGNMNIDNIASYYWNLDDNAIWKNSPLNTINLNNLYLNYLKDMWSDKIAITNWYLNGASISDSLITWYDAERSGDSISAKIGLMYASDYGYASDTSYWNLTMWSYSNAANSNWLFNGLYEWIIYSNNSSNSAPYIGGNGNLSSLSISNFGCAIRPCFYLNSNVAYISGTGTISDPIRIN